MDKKEKVLLGAACFLGGVVLGFLISPIKGGIYCGNHNGNYLKDGEKEEEEEEEVILAENE